MQTTELGSTGVHVSRLALGAMQMGNATPEDESIRILDRYVEAGGSFIDTADCYEWWASPGSRGGESEELLGRWLRGRRDNVFVATKGSALPVSSPDLWAADGTPNWDLARRTFAGAGKSTLTAALDGSLRRLGTDHIDLYYVHVDDRSTPLEETLEALDGFVKSGKIRFIGWSNVRTWRLERIRQLCAQNGWAAPVALQQRHSYLRTTPDDVSEVDGEQLDYLREHRDLSLVAYSPIAKGMYDKATDDPRLATLNEVAKEVGATPNQVVVAWMMQQDDPPAIPLIGPRTYAQLENLLPALDLKVDLR